MFNTHDPLRNLLARDRTKTREAKKKEKEAKNAKRSRKQLAKELDDQAVELIIRSHFNDERKS